MNDHDDVLGRQVRSGETVLVIGAGWSKFLAAVMIMMIGAFGSWAWVVLKSSIEVRVTMTSMARQVIEHERQSWHSNAGLEIARLGERMDAVEDRLRSPSARSRADD